jgi:hypothetical protein
MTAGSVASVAMPMGKVIKRESGITKGIKKKMVDEGELSENDLILVPGQMSKRSKGFVSKDRNEMERIEMAKSDVVQSVKSATAIFSILKNSDDEIEGWVQEKLAKAEDYLDTVREYLEGKSMPAEGMSAGVRMQRALQREKEKRERSERYAEKHFPIGKKPEQNTEPQKEVKEDDKAVDDFLARGGKIQYGKSQKGPKKPGLSYASKHIGGSGDKMKMSRTGFGTKSAGNKPVVTAEGSTDWMDDMRAMAHKMAPQDKMRERQAERDAQAKAERQQKIQQDIENLPDLISQFRDMKSEYESMGGSNWQYADNEQNLSDEERKARGMETSMRQLADRIHTAKKASEGLAESKPDFAKMFNKKIGKHNAAVVKTKKEIGTRVADIGPGGKEYNVKTDKEWDKQKGVTEVAPPGAKAERMVKHIKKSYNKDGKITPKEKSIAYATAWKAHNKGKVEEQGVAEGSESKDTLISTLNSFGYYTDDSRVYVNDDGDKIVRVGSEWKHQSGKRGRGAEELGDFLSSNQGVAEGSMYGDEEVSWEKGGTRAPTGAFRNPAVKKVVFSGTGDDGGKYEVIQSGPDDYMIHANDKHIDTYPSLQRAMSVLKNEVSGLKKSVDEESKGLWANIHAKRERIKQGSGEKMRTPGSKGAPTADALRKSAK